MEEILKIKKNGEHIFMNRNLWGFNPNFKEFMEKRPNLTVIGVFWASYWRIAILGLAIELALVLFFASLGALLSLISHS